jgi:hypothetical protein
VNKTEICPFSAYSPNAEQCSSERCEQQHIASTC